MSAPSEAVTTNRLSSTIRHCFKVLSICRTLVVVVLYDTALCHRTRHPCSVPSIQGLDLVQNVLLCAQFRGPPSFTDGLVLTHRRGPGQAANGHLRVPNFPLNVLSPGSLLSCGPLASRGGVGPAQFSLCVAASSRPQRPTLSSPAEASGLPSERALPRAGPRHPPSCAPRDPALDHQKAAGCYFRGDGVPPWLCGHPTAGRARVQAPPPLAAPLIHALPRCRSPWADRCAHLDSLLEARNLFRCAGQDRHPSAGPAPILPQHPQVRTAGRPRPRVAAAAAAHQPSRAKGSTPASPAGPDTPEALWESEPHLTAVSDLCGPVRRICSPQARLGQASSHAGSTPGAVKGASEFPSASWPLHTGAPIFLYTACFTGSQGELIQTGFC
ncbi:hypothetical protein NDU88_006999 [Pleurodeles waltl]|uniref:Uncharacterized protein n=1 Tax=Pleurodeles waltl TaxID=8319 RepID=A0AAV7UNM3_PLEWA|nr:hypothetical protein NDU88_006999 [Pleurodeles waltl]